MNAGALLFGGAAEHGQSTRLLFFIFIIFPRRAHVGFDREFLWNVFVAGLQLSGKFPVAAKGDTWKFCRLIWGRERCPRRGSVGLMCAGVLVAGRRDGHGTLFPGTKHVAMQELPCSALVLSWGNLQLRKSHQWLERQSGEGSPGADPVPALGEPDAASVQSCLQLKQLEVLAKRLQIPSVQTSLLSCAGSFEAESVVLS